MLPTFVCIGAQKTGTTWLYNQLSQHPQIFLPKIKELNFFCRDHERAQYERYFQGAKENQKRGDISPKYLIIPGVAERMHKVIPDAKLICILRDPVARAVSQYNMAVELGNISAATSFIEAFRQNLQYICERGCYTELLERFTRFYPKAQLNAVLYDDLVSDSVKFLREIQKYIDVDEEFTPKALDTRVNASKTTIDLTSDEENEVYRYYVQHIAALENYLGRSLSAWHRN